VSDRIRQPQKPQQIDVAFDGRRDGLELDASRSGDIADARHDARGERVQQELYRSRSVALTAQYGVVVAVVLKDLGVRMFTARAAEHAYRRAAVRSGEPLIGGPEAKLGKLRGLAHGVDGRKQHRRIDPVQRLDLALGFRGRLFGAYLSHDTSLVRGRTLPGPESRSGHRRAVLGRHLGATAPKPSPPPRQRIVKVD